MMQRNGVWLPLIASIGVGAATYYSMSRNNQGIGQVMQQFMPGKTSTTGNSSNNGNNSGMLGPYGMS